MSNNVEHQFGWIPSPLDERDFPALFSSVITELPEEHSLQSIIREVMEQKDPWCVAYAVCNAVCSALEAIGIKPPGGLSVSYLYTRCKQLDRIPNIPGTYIRVALDIALKEGICSEAVCPSTRYIGTGNLPTISTAMKNDAAKYRISSYSRILNTIGTNFVSIDGIKRAIADNSFVIIGTWATQDNWLDSDEYIIEPKGNYLGGHCTFLHSYNNKAVIPAVKASDGKNHTGIFPGLNSWGKKWGLNGHYFMAYDYTQWGSKGITTDDSLVPCFQEAWTFKVSGEVNVTTVISDIPMQIIKNRAVLPFRAVYESLGADVGWHYNMNKKIVAVANLTMNGDVFEIVTTEGSTNINITKNGNNYSLVSDLPMQIINGRTVLPFRVIYEALGATVDWYYNANRKIVAIATLKVNNSILTIETVEGKNTIRTFNRPVV